jgi:glyoxylase-like metal-dependent hydrolase (beta-lactamase superfamily II)
MRTTVIGLIAVLTLGAAAQSLHAEESTSGAPNQAITLLRGNLYQVRDGREHTVFLVTRDGIVIVDPLSRPAAMALKEELDARFPGVQVRYVVLTHHHADRAAGARVFDKADIVANRAFNEQLAQSRRANEAEYRFVREVRDSFDTRRTIRIGDTSVQLVHVRSTHATDMTVVYFADERTIFAVTPPPSVNAAPFMFDGARAGDAYAWIDTVAELQPDLLVFDDGTTMEGAALQQLAEYLRTIRTGVLAAYERGISLNETQATSPLAAQPAGPHSSARATHISAMYRSLRLVRVELSASAIASYTSRNAPGPCGGTWSICSAGGAVSGGTGSIAVTLGNRFGVLAEATYSQQYWSSRTRTGFQEETALRLSRTALLFRYGGPRPGRFSYLPVVGVSRTEGDVRGLSHVTGVLTPIGGYHLISDRTTRSGLTVGVDLLATTGRGFSISAPVRLTRINGKRPEHWPAMFDVQAGIGISVPVMRHVRMR